MTTTTTPTTCPTCGDALIRESIHNRSHPGYGRDFLVCLSHGSADGRTYARPAPAYRVARLGNGTALHLVDANGILCNRWGTVNGVWRAPRFVEGAEATCKRCARLATAVSA